MLLISRLQSLSNYINYEPIEIENLRDKIIHNFFVELTHHNPFSEEVYDALSYARALNFGLWTESFLDYIRRTRNSYQWLKRTIQWNHDHFEKDSYYIERVFGKDEYMIGYIYEQISEKKKNRSTDDIIYLLNNEDALKNASVEIYPFLQYYKVIE